MDGTHYDKPKKKAEPVTSWGEKVTTKPPVKKATPVSDWGEEVIVSEEPVKKKDGALETLLKVGQDVTAASKTGGANISIETPTEEVSLESSTPNKPEPVAIDQPDILESTGQQVGRNVLRGIASGAFKKELEADTEKEPTGIVGAMLEKARMKSDVSAISDMIGKELPDQKSKRVLKEFISKVFNGDAEMQDFVNIYKKDPASFDKIKDALQIDISLEDTPGEKYKEDNYVWRVFKDYESKMADGQLEQGRINRQATNFGVTTGLPFASSFTGVEYKTPTNLQEAVKIADDINNKESQLRSIHGMVGANSIVKAAEQQEKLEKQIRDGKKIMPALTEMISGFVFDEMSKENPNVRPIDVGRRTLELIDPKTYALYKDAGGDKRAQSSLGSLSYYETPRGSVDYLNREMTEIGLNAYRTFGNKAAIEKANEEGRYLNFTYTAPLEERAKHMIAATLLDVGIKPHNATQEQKDEVAKLLPEIYRETWFGANKENNNQKLPSTGFGYSAKGAYKNTIEDATSTLLGWMVPDKKRENALAALEQQYTSNLVGENPVDKARLASLKQKEKTKGLSGDELKEKEYLEQFTGVRNWRQKFLDLAGSGTGQLAGFGTTSFFTGGASNVKNIPTALRSLVTPAVGGKGTLAASYMVSREQNLRDAAAKYPGDDNFFKRFIATEVGTLADSFTERLFPEQKVLSGLIKKDIQQLIPKLTAQNLRKELNQSLAEKMAKSFVKKAGTFLETPAQEALEEIAAAKIKDVFDNVLDPDHESMTFDDLVETGTQAFLSSSFLGAPKGIMAQRNKYVPLNAIWDAASEPGNYFGTHYKILEMKAKGELTDQEANERISMLTTAKNLYEQSPVLSGGMGNLSLPQRQNYLARQLNEQLLEKKIKEEEAKPVPDKNVVADYKKQIADSEKARKAIYEGEVVVDNQNVEKNVPRGVKEAKDRWKANIVAIDERTDIDEDEKERLKEIEDERHAIEIGKEGYSPVEVIVQQAAKNALAGGYSELVNQDNKLAEDVLVDYAKQKYGLSDDGSDLLDKPSNETSIPPTEEELRNGEQPVSILDAETRMSNGERIFIGHEMAETEPFEVRSVEELRKYAPDQMIAIPPKSDPFAKTTEEVVPIQELPDVETHEQVLSRAKTGEPIEIEALRIQKSDDTNKETGVFFADKGIIEEYQKREKSGFYGEENKGLFSGDVKKYKLSFENPLVIRSQVEFIKGLAENGDLEAREVLPNWQKEYPLFTTHETHAEKDKFVARKARELGYDGIITPLEYIALGDKTFTKNETSIPPTEEGVPIQEKVKQAPPITNPIVDAAVTKMFPDKASLQAYIQKNDVSAKATQVGQEIAPILQRINDADYINEKELDEAADKLYNILDAVEKSKLTDEQKESSRDLIEPIIQKLEGYEFRTKTETRQVAEKVPTGRTNKTKIEVKPPLERAVGSRVTVKSKSGTESTGVLKIENGNYYVYDGSGNKVSALGNATATNWGLKFPEGVENPIEFDEDGNVSAVSFETKDGTTVRIERPETALDIAIQLQAEALGEIPDDAFQEVYDEVVKTIPTEVLVKEQKTESSKNIKSTQDGKGKESRSQEGSVKTSTKESGDNQNKQGNQPSATIPVEGNQNIESFETSKGSVYTVLPDGRTQRFKTKTGEQNEPQDLTVFVEFKGQQEDNFLEAVQRSKDSGDKVYVSDEKGKVVRTNEEAAGKKLFLVIVNKEGKPTEWVEATTTPSVGKTVFDMRSFDKDGETFTERHIGNAVTKINSKSEPGQSSKSIPVEGSPLTQEAIDLLASIGGGSKPTFITKNLERIAKENGIVVDNTTTADDIINQLKQKNTQNGKGKEGRSQEGSAKTSTKESGEKGINQEGSSKETKGEGAPTPGAADTGTPKAGTDSGTGAPSAGTDTGAGTTSTATQEKGAKETSQEGDGLPPDVEGGAPVQESEDGGIGITHAETEKTRERYGWEEYENVDRSTFENWDREAAERLKKEGMEPLLAKMRRGEPITPVEQRMMFQIVGYYDNLVSKDPSDENFRRYQEAVQLSDRVGGSQAGQILGARRGRARYNETLASYMLQRAEELGVETLTPGQKVATEIMFKKIQDAQAKFDEYVKGKEAELAQREAALKIEEMKKKSNRSKKKEDLSKERSQIIDDILLKFAKDDKVSFLGVGKLVEIAPDVLKLARNLLDSGINTLGEIVDNIHTALTDKKINIEKEEINGIIAGRYNEKRPKRTELAEKWENLKQEARLIEKWEALVRGEEPTNETKLTKRNAKLNELSKKIKEHPLTKASAKRKSEGRRLEELQDQLAKLDAGIIPDLPKKEKKEINEEIKSLQKSIKEHDIQMLAEIKRDMKAQIDKIKEDLDKGNFEKEEKKEIELDDEGKTIQKELATARREWKYALMADRYKKRTVNEKRLDNIGKFMNIPRSAIASSDFSAIFNQGLIATISHPIMAAKAINQMLKSTQSEGEYIRWHHQVEDSQRWDLIKDDMKVRITDPFSPFSSHREDQFNVGYAEAALDKVLGRKFNPIRLSERAYSQFLNKLRWDLANRLINKFEEDGKTYKNSKKLYEFAGQFVNDITGSSNLPFGLEQYAGFLNGLFFSPRMLISRLKLLSPYYLFAAPKELKAEYAKEMGKSLGLVTSVLGAFYLKGLGQDDDDPNKIHVEFDPRSSDFMKLRQGNTRWNPLGGFQSIIRATGQFVLGNKSTNTGLITGYDKDSPFAQKRGDVLWRFIRGKFSPSAALITDLIQGEDMVGEPVTLRSSLWDNLMPLTIQSVFESWKDYGALSLANTLVPNFLGIGTQTYEPRQREIKKTITVQEKVDGQSHPHKVKLTDEQYKAYEDKARELIDKQEKKLEKNKDFQSLDLEQQVLLRRTFQNAAIREAEDWAEKKYKTQLPKFSKEEKEEIREKQKKEKKIKKELKLK